MGSQTSLHQPKENYFFQMIPISQPVKLASQILRLKKKKIKMIGSDQEINLLHPRLIIYYLRKNVQYGCNLAVNLNFTINTKLTKMLQTLD